ncbi:hypothetical protein BDN72DRAFT_836186 [Pluteus cervinus]|uniref:Uncharacterized protein n=1 Tax=Pluteus cervinus TaxID=181527 RepID=A0ACD3B2X5_9AGAR|nr:hypothetical protein BDN72DRAFT_836186 [Pluteus cervinus]
MCGGVIISGLYILRAQSIQALPETFTCHEPILSLRFNMNTTLRPFAFSLWIQGTPLIVRFPSSIVCQCRTARLY